MHPREFILTSLVLLCAVLIVMVTIVIYPNGLEKTDATDVGSSTHSADLLDPAATGIDREQTFGAEPNPTGSPIGGGDGHQDIITPEDRRVESLVTTIDELIAALQEAESGDIVYIDETAWINLTETPGRVTIPGGVTLAGNRGARSVTGTTSYLFDIVEPGNYVLWACTSAQDEDRGTLWISVDQEEIRRWDLELDQDWHWYRAGARYLPAGQHTLNFHWREGDLNLDTIFITKDADRHPDAVTEEPDGAGGIHIEAESGVLSPDLEQIRDPTASGGAYVSVPGSTTGGEYHVSPGGLIYLGPAGSDHRTGLVAGRENVRITGIRLEGPDPGNEKVEPAAIGIFSAYRNLEVDNCEIWGWSGAAVGIFGTSGSDMKTGGYIHHNYIHHCQMDGLGYGVVVSGGAVSLIEANYFDHCRHAIAGSGVAGDGYEARYNICGPNFTAGSSSHNFDMHGTTSGSDIIAGDTIRIHHNTFMATGPLNAFPVAIRGVPRDGAYIDHNWFYYTQAPPVWQTGGQGKVSVTENLIGKNRTFSASGPIEYY